MKEIRDTLGFGAPNGTDTFRAIANTLAIASRSDFGSGSMAEK